MWYRIVTTSHVAKEAIARVAAAVEEYEPDIVAVELDRNRLHALLSRQRPGYSPTIIRSTGLRGYLFAVIGGLIQRRIGKMVNVTPGADMLAAVQEARQRKLPVLLIDRDVRLTLRRLSRSLGWRELRQSFVDLWRGLVHRERIRIPLDKVPSERLVRRLLGEFKKRYPRPYHVLVEERNQFMAHALLHYHAQHPEHRILVVIGAGHEGINRLLEAGKTEDI